MTRRSDHGARPPQPNRGRVPFGGRIILFAAAAGMVLVLLAYHAFTWRSFTTVIGVCQKPFCDFVDFYYPMGAAVFDTGLPVRGFLYSPFVAILLAAFPPLGLTASLVVWGVLQALFLTVYLLMFRWLVPSGLPIQLLFVALTLSSFPLPLNFLGGSVSFFMMAALLGLLVLYGRGHRAAASVLLAFAASFKFYPLMFLAPFLARRDTRFLVFGAAACGALLLMVPGVLLGTVDTLRFYGGLLDSFRHSDWVVTNVHSQYFPHVVRRLAAAAGYDASAHLALLRWIAWGVTAANVGLLFLVQRARLRHADLWSFQILFMTVPFVLKTSWASDFVFLPFTQTLLVWWLVGGAQADPGTNAAEERPFAGGWRARTPPARVAVTCCLLPSVVISNVVLFNVLGDFRGYGSSAFIFWADVLLLMASYVVLLPSALRRLRGTDVQGGRAGLMNRPGVAGPYSS